MRKIRTDEEKIAKQLTDLVSDVTLDIEQVGKYVARNSATVLQRRLKIVIEAADYEKEKGGM